MVYGLYLSAAGMMANDYRQDVVANNLANVNTAAFKPDVPIFQQRLPELLERGASVPTPTPVFEQLPGGLHVAPARIDLKPGALQPTDRALDVALRGSGFLKVRHRSQLGYTRDGRLELDKAGQLQALSGAEVLDEQDRPIQLDRQQRVVISRDGRIYQGNEEVARLALVELPDSRAIRKMGDNVYLYVGTEPPRPAASTVLEPGFIEASGADPVKQMTLLIQAARAFEANATLVRYQDQTLGRAVNDVGRIA